MRKLQIVIAFMLVVSLLSCESLDSDFLDDDTHLADFSYQIKGDCSTPVLEVILENKMLGADTYFWDFGDGTILLSSEKVIKHQYAGLGSYSAVLIVQNGEGCNCATAFVDLTP